MLGTDLNTSLNPNGYKIIHCAKQVQGQFFFVDFEYLKNQLGDVLQKRRSKKVHKICWKIPLMSFFLEHLLSSVTKFGKVSFWESSIWQICCTKLSKKGWFDRIKTPT